LSLPFGTTDTWTLCEIGSNVEVIAQVVDYQRREITRGKHKGGYLITLRLDTAAGIIKAVVFPDALARCEKHIHRNAVLLVKGTKEYNTVNGHELHVKSMKPFKEEANIA